ncbi:latent-transforming growth factor beta-binding protein 1 isoform 2-T2 [Clarias gariepinus]|uniref:latent-transforming growth factor beta-binding protein 1 isoform X2 n=1 Tax=Clarias gariepinus TaxID=13013 RepID=UPI00234CC33E|nr:latent-transforming growth factor beta-binding protein 1 isoform X2 [Clarias gariepinus]
MAGIRCNFTPLLLSSLLLTSFLSLFCSSPSCALQMDRVRVSSVSTYGVELHGVGGSVRTRRTGTSTSGLTHHMKVSGVNVCGGQCCIGWSQAPGSQRCTRPNCLPKCQNGGMCLRPQMCVCKPGSKGKLCEQTSLPTSSQPSGRPVNRHTNGHDNGHSNGHTLILQRPIPQQVFPQGPASYPLPSTNMAHMTLNMKAGPNSQQPIPFQQHIQRPVSINMQQAKNQKFVIKPNFYPSHNTHTQLHGAGYPPERSIPLSAGHHPLHVANHTGRIKLVFTPTICKLTCSGGRCHNTCEKGNTTTIISENGRATDTLTAPNFRVVVCHLPCMNGGKCNARDKCQCPPNFTGKFCQMPTQNGASTNVHTTHTLPLSYGHSQGVVNIHVNHPPEASVQIHQVSQVDSSSTVQKFQQHSTYTNQQSFLHYQPVTSKSQLGRCFQETTGMQCGKALPGLSKQEDCCGTIGTSWGFHKCQKCPRKQSIPLLECPHGYKRFNSTRCIDVNECQLPGVCPNGNCINTPGSYRCLCQPGFIPDSTLTSCYPAFKEICPGGLGYQVTNPYFYKPKPPPPPPVNPEVHERGDGHRPVITHPKPTIAILPLPVPTPQQPVEAFGFTERHLPVRVVVEKTSPVAPVVLLPSSASQDINPTQFAEVDECVVRPDICGHGFCYDTAESYNCICDKGYKLNDEETTCVDVDECVDDPHLCVNGRCRNTPGSFTCVCKLGFSLEEKGTSCVDINECEAPYVCPENSLCVNTPGSYTCRQCSKGYTLGQSGQCEDVDECQNGSVCPSGLCYNTLGSYMCSPCPEGFQGKDGKCVDIDECVDSSVCVHGQCSNREGFFICTCDDGFTPTPDRKACTDIDECQDESVCTRGHCANTEGAFICHCGSGFTLSESGEQCDDVDECQEQGGLCDNVGQCVNNIGSYHCNCPPGYRQVNGTRCQDIDECVEEPLKPHSVECVNTEGSFYFICEPGYAWTQDPPECEDVDECTLNRSVCGHGACHNTVGSFLCQCDPGYEDKRSGQGCEDMNECELLSDVCGEAVCENVPGSFICVCPEEGFEFNQMTAKCLPAPKASSTERKVCYYNLSDENLCDNVLASNVTIEECCCTLGAGWGDNCEVFPCPIQDSDQFTQMCPAGRGNIPKEDNASPVTYKDADECEIFKDEICKDGFCQDTQGAFECYCKAGLYYDENILQCLDTDECLDELNCVDGQCINNYGSYQCFCTPPRVLDPTHKRCVLPEAAEPREQQGVFQEICWQTVSPTLTCTNMLNGRVTTYTECCCLYGEAWGMQCALCPPKHSEDYAVMCNLRGSGSVRHPYGQDALVARPGHEYEVPLEYDPQVLPPNPNFYEDYDDSNTGRYESFEGLRAEECGVLNGCENGRCVRVQKGYTCDCFDGYTLDMSRMACVDVNECTELNKRMSLCRNGKCINTQGSYKCQCLPGYTPSEKPNYCVPIMPSASTGTE